MIRTLRDGTRAVLVASREVRPRCEENHRAGGSVTRWADAAVQNTIEPCRRTGDVMDLRSLVATLAEMISEREQRLPA
jgi:hypothetical protein